MAFEAGLFGRAKGGGIMGIVIDIVVAGGTGVFQLLDMETVRDRNTIRIQIGRSPLDIKNTRVTTDAVRIDLVQFSREAGMFPSALERKDVDARHQGMACRMTLRTADLGMQGRLFPKGGLPLLTMAGDTEFLLRRSVGGQGNGGIKAQDSQNAP